MDAAIPESPAAVKPLQAVDHLPAVKLRTVKGETFDLNGYVKKRPAVLVFYRGGWCPYCNMHLKELMEAEPELQKLGYQILAVSPDKVEKIAASAARHQLTYTLLSDASMAAAKAFGVAFSVAETTVTRYKEMGLNLEEASGENHHLLPVPAVFILDKKGVVRYSYHNADYKTRLSGKEILQAARESL